MDNTTAKLEVKRLKTVVNGLKTKRRLSLYRQKRSKLDQYRGELIMMRQAGATCTLLYQWLREKRVKVVFSTLTRWVKKNAIISEK